MSSLYHLMPESSDKMHSSDAFGTSSVELDWSPMDMLDQASSFITHSAPGNLDDLASIMSCKQPGSSLDTLSESIWDKFDLLHYILDESPLDSLDEDELLPASEIVRLSSSLESNPSPISEMRHHDCMWAGLCRHEEHGDADLMVTPPCSPTFDICVPSPAVPRKVIPVVTPAAPRPTNSRSLLVPRKELKKMEKQSFMDLEHRPETPVSDFDESFHSMRYYSNNEDEDSETDSIQSSSETEEDCVDSSTSTIDSRYLNHGPSYITDHTYGRPAFRQPPDTNNYGLCTPSDSEEEIDVVSLQNELTLPETTIIKEELCSPVKRAKLTPTKRSARQSARAARASTLASKRSSQSHDFQEELQNSLAAMAAEAAKDVVPPLRLRLQQAGAKRRKSAPVSSSDNSSDSSSDDATPTLKRGHKRSRLSKKLSAAARKRCAQASSSGRSSSDSEERSGKRTMHNTMERQRRVDLRNAFESLRKFIPELLNSEKAPKVTILREASNYCMALQEEEASQERIKRQLLKRQAALRQRLADARRHVASARR
ncbi:uncharacterized protein LOC132205946 [Neocloeon triangulifer]|uniref:uncharacterized protein LOC132205946 n=1 Tax=Neocloeon triangulifer TaxID=2078957 RepID=UPI00286F10A1|nr:uncharacterized protein LOC132205946 [Neocloeon triangulifer]